VRWIVAEHAPTPAVWHTLGAARMCGHIRADRTDIGSPLRLAGPVEQGAAGGGPRPGREYHVRWFRRRITGPARPAPRLVPLRSPARAMAGAAPRTGRWRGRLRPARRVGEYNRAVHCSGSRSAAARSETGSSGTGVAGGLQLDITDIPVPFVIDYFVHRRTFLGARYGGCGEIARERPMG
jgi:hypothetical protein